MTRNITSLRKLRRDKRAVSPAISTVVLTSAVVVLLIVTIAFANNFLDARLAENEFTAMEQFMQTVGLQVDDVAWIIGRTQTIRYASKYGQVNFENEALVYSVYVDDVLFANYSVGLLLFNMPVSKYSIGNNYYENIFPSDRSFLQEGTSAPVSYVYARERLPMLDGSFIRVVVTPIIRMLNSTISMSGIEENNYFKFYLPILSNGTSPYHSQSVTLTGKDVLVKTEDNVNEVEIRISFPRLDEFFDSLFFNFEEGEIVVDVPDGSIIEFYTSEVSVSIGL
jgi:uncharacterized membrane protein (DUF485 family)